MPEPPLTPMPDPDSTEAMNDGGSPGGNFQGLSTREWSALAGQRIGPFVLIRELGRGGMGVVYLAMRQEGDFQQRVAVKLYAPGLNTESLMGRFRQERKILARLDHPGIARLLDGGSTADGTLYYVMEFVDGIQIDEYCRERKLGLKETLRLFQQVCAAVHYAHQGLVVHRDLKPSNILVIAPSEAGTGTGEEPGTVKLLDFGIAKLLAEEEETAEDGFAKTRTNVRLMTPRYASPEQVQAQAATTASDVYSLGVVLYELLTGSMPYAGSISRIGELEQAIVEKEPIRPSEKLSTLRGDLDNILLACLQKEPQRRYSSAEALREDLERYLDGRPVKARRDTATYRVSKFVRRHRWGVGAAAVVALALIGSAAVSIDQAQKASAALELAREERSRAEEQAKLAQQRAQEAERERKLAQTQKEIAALAAKEADRQRMLAVESGRVARERYEDVRKLANELLADVRAQLENVPGTTGAQGALVAQALQFLGRLAKDEPVSAELRRELAGAYLQISNLQFNGRVSHLDDWEGAQASLREAEKWLQDGGEQEQRLRAEWFLQRAELAVGNEAKEAALREGLAALGDSRSEDRMLRAKLKLGLAGSYFTGMEYEKGWEACREVEALLRAAPSTAKEREDWKLMQARLNLLWVPMMGLSEEEDRQKRAEDTVRALLEESKRQPYHEDIRILRRSALLMQARQLLEVRETRRAEEKIAMVQKQLEEDGRVDAQGAVSRRLRMKHLLELGSMAIASGNQGLGLQLLEQADSDLKRNEEQLERLRPAQRYWRIETLLTAQRVFAYGGIASKQIQYWQEAYQLLEQQEENLPAVMRNSSAYLLMEAMPLQLERGPLGAEAFSRLHGRLSALLARAGEGITAGRLVRGRLMSREIEADYKRRMKREKEAIEALELGVLEAKELEGVGSEKERSRYRRAKMLLQIGEMELRVGRMERARAANEDGVKIAENWPAAWTEMEPVLQVYLPLKMQKGSLARSQAERARTRDLVRRAFERLEGSLKTEEAFVRGYGRLSMALSALPIYSETVEDHEWYRGALRRSFARLVDIPARFVTTGKDWLWLTGASTALTQMSRQAYDAEGIGYAEKSLARMRKAIDLIPKTAGAAEGMVAAELAYRDIALWLGRKEEAKRASAQLEELIEGAEQIGVERKRNLQLATRVWKFMAGPWTQAGPGDREALRKLAEVVVEPAERQAKLAGNLMNLAMLQAYLARQYRAAGAAVEAMGAYRKAIELTNVVAAQRPETAMERQQLFQYSAEALATAYEAGLGEASWRGLVVGNKAELKVEPSRLDYLSTLQWGVMRLAPQWRSFGNLEESERQIQKALALLDELEKLAPGREEWKLRRADCMAGMVQGKMIEAVRAEARGEAARELWKVAREWNQNRTKLWEEGAKGGLPVHYRAFEATSRVDTLIIAERVGD